VGGKASRVTLGNIGVRGRPPVQGDELLVCLKRFLEKLQEKQFRPGANWVRLFYAQTESKTLALEVLLNNSPWTEMLSDVVVIDWPSGEEFYSVRVFLVIEVEERDSATQDVEGSRTPEAAVALLAEIIAPRHEVHPDELIAPMADAGVP